jgi:hypothetical protein
MGHPQNTKAREVAGFLYLYFQCSEVGGAKWQVSEEMFQSQFQIGK